MTARILHRQRRISSILARDSEFQKFKEFLEAVECWMRDESCKCRVIKSGSRVTSVPSNALLIYPSPLINGGISQAWSRAPNDISMSPGSSSRVTASLIDGAKTLMVFVLSITTRAINTSTLSSLVASLGWMCWLSDPSPKSE